MCVSTPAVNARMLQCPCLLVWLPPQDRAFPVMVLDEATQATEPASLVPIMARVSGF
jgi:superfamily I DNA and/or RNA helicase